MHQTASAVEADGTRNLAVPREFNTFELIGGTGAFQLEGAPFVLKIVKLGPVVRGTYVYIVFFDGTNYKTEISDLFLFNKSYKWDVMWFLKKMGVNS